MGTETNGPAGIFSICILQQIGEARLGQRLKRGDPLGFPSCEGGTATGTNVHIARKYNGEWIPIDSAIPFNLEGWIAHTGDTFYQGTLTRGSQIVTASLNSNLGTSDPGRAIIKQETNGSRIAWRHGMVMHRST